MPRRRPHAPPRHRARLAAGDTPAGLSPELLARLAREGRPAWVITLKLSGRRRVRYIEQGDREPIVAALDEVLGPGGYTISPAPKIPN